MTLPRFSRTASYKKAYKTLDRDQLMAIAHWGRELAAAESAGHLRDRVGDREGQAAGFEIGAGLILRARITLRPDGSLGECELLDILHRRQVLDSTRGLGDQVERLIDEERDRP